MKQIGLFKNENVPVPLLPQETEQWQYVTANFDRTKSFRKIRVSTSPVVNDWRFSNVSGVNSDNMSNTSIDNAQYGWGNHLRTAYFYGVALTLPNNGVFTDFVSTWRDKQITTVGTYIGVGEDGYDVYEYEYPIDLYWSGCPTSTLYSQYPYKLQVYTY